MIAANRDAGPDDEPSARAPTGQFGPGNKFAKGNRHSRRLSAARDAISEAITPSDLADVARALLVQAKAGNVQAAKELFDRVLGRPAPAADIDDDGAPVGGHEFTPEKLQDLLRTAGKRLAELPKPGETL